MKCFVCRCDNGNVEERSLEWHVRPKNKYNEPDYFDTLLVDLCTDCWEFNMGNCLIGWDWWDAVDGLISSETVSKN